MKINPIKTNITHSLKTLPKIKLKDKTTNL